jgi:hypothetical protein
MHPHRDREIGELFWADHPKVRLGPHDGLPDALRERLPPKSRKPAQVANKAAFKLKPAKKRK